MEEVDQGEVIVYIRRMPQISAEIRWFLSGAETSQVDAFTRWFHGGLLPPGGGLERIDVYANDTSTNKLGVKERNRKKDDRRQRPPLEVKALVVPALGTVTFGPRDATIQVWSKVGSHLVEIPDESGARCITHKMRWLRKFDTAGISAVEVELGAGSMKEDPVNGPRPDIGCNIEWTRVSVEGDPRVWWSSGAEAFAFGMHGSVEEILTTSLHKALAALVEQQGTPPMLGSGWNELSYPAWIQQL